MIYSYLLPPALPTLISVPGWIVGSSCEDSQRWSHSLQILGKNSLVKVYRAIFMEVGQTCDNALPIFLRLPCDNAIQPDNMGMIQTAKNMNLKGRSKVY